MNVKHRALLTIIMMFLPSVILSSLVLIPEEVSAYTLHDPIRIDGDAEFTAANGVTGGTGSPTDPFIIEGWEINASTDRGILIINTQAHFYIRDVYVHSGSMDTPENDGISIQNSRNGRIENCSLSNNQMGISASGSNIAIRNNTFTSDGVAIGGRTLEEARSNIVTSDNLVNGKPIHLYKDGTDLHIVGGWIGQLLVLNYTNVRISHLNLNDTSFGISIAYAENVVVTDNEITNSTGGISVSMATNVTIYSNLVYNNVVGIAGAYLDNSTITSNSVTSNSYCGIMVDKTNDSFVSANQIYENHVGLGIEHTRNVTIAYNHVEDNEYGVAYDAPMSMTVHHNNFIDNIVQVNPRIGTWNSWDDGYPSGGNYWSDYNGVDLMGGASQDEIGDDGFGDTPYAVDSDTQDNYPRMNGTLWIPWPDLPYNELPTVSIISPTQGETVSGEYMIVGTAWDPEDTLQIVEVKIDEGNWTEVTGDPYWNFDWDTTNVTNGIHTIHVRSFDGEFYSAEVFVTVTVDNPTSDGPEDWLFVAVAVSIIIIVVVMLLYIFFKKRKMKGEEESIEPILEESS